MTTLADIEHTESGVGSGFRVALFTGAYNHIADGVSRTLNRLVAHLEQEGFAVRVFAPTVREPQVDHAGTLVPVPSVAAPGRPDYRLSLGLTPAVRRELADFDPHLYHVATPDILGVQALMHARQAGRPLVASYHTHFASYLQYYNLQIAEPLVWKYLRWFYGHCEQIYVPSPSMKDVLAKQGIAEGTKLWERGVDTTRFNPERRSIEWRRERGFADDDVVIAFVSRLVLEKGLKRMARMLQRLEERGTPFKILIVGDGPARDDLAEMLPQAVFTGYLEGEHLARAYASSDIFLFPSDTETFGNATLEAMASGLPTVCAEATGSLTLVKEGETGFLLPSDDIDGFADRLCALITDDELRERMGGSAQQAAARYDWSEVLQRIVNYYLELLRPNLRHDISRPQAPVFAALI